MRTNLSQRAAQHLPFLSVRRQPTPIRRRSYLAARFASPSRRGRILALLWPRVRGHAARSDSRAPQIALRRYRLTTSTTAWIRRGPPSHCARAFASGSRAANISRPSRHCFAKSSNRFPSHRDGFTFIDLGSGKGRTLLMASSFPFRRIIGMELLEELNAIASQNIARYHSDEQRCFAIESHAGDARYFEFPAEPPCCTCSILFRDTSGARCWRTCTVPCKPRRVPSYVIYHNPVHEDIPNSQPWLHEVKRTHQFVIYQTLAQ